VAADWQELMTPQSIIWPPIVHASEQLCMFQMASKRRIFGSLAVLCQHISDDVIQCFVDHCLADPFHRLSADNAADEGNMLLCESVFTGLGEVAQLPRDSVSETVYSLLTGSALTAIYQLLPTHHQVCVACC